MQIKNQVSLVRKTLFGIMLLGMFFSTFGTGGLLFAHASSSDVDPHLAGFEMLSPGEGWVQLNNSIFWTGNDGETWTNITPVLSARAGILAIKFADDHDGWVLWADDTASYLSHTTDAANWITQTFDFSNELALKPEHVWMYWLDSQTGWISARWSSGVNFSLGKLWHTNDGGATWQGADLPLGESVYFVDSQHGWLAGGPAGDQLFYTRDAGKTWTASQSFYQKNTSISLTLPQFSDPDHGTLLGFRALGNVAHLEIYTTSDGQKWKLLRVDDANLLSNSLPLAWVGSQTVSVINGDELLRVTNTDTTKITTNPIVESIRELDMFSANYGWARWENGSCQKNVGAVTCSSTTKLLRTIDGGKTWNALILPVIQSDKIVQTSVAQNLTAKSTLSKLGNTQIAAGQGFDKCEIASISQLQTWWDNSPYSAVNLYYGGAGRYCDNNPLSASYLQQLSQQGWSFIPTWVGLQSPCYGGAAPKMSLDTTTAYNQGVNEANLAVDQLAVLGLTNADQSGSVVYYDLEGAGSAGTSCRNAESAFINGWVAQVHARNNIAGVYGSSCASALNNFAAIANVPDAIWPAATYVSYYDPGATTSVSCIPAGSWPNHQRIRQYTPGHNETWGGVTLNIDSDVMDGVVALYNGAGNTVPSGFNQILSGIGVALYKKDYAGGQPDYVQVVDLNQGASVKLMTGSMASPGTGGRPFGGNNPTFTSTSLATAWNSFNSSTSGAFCITNGAFFSGPQYNPTPLAFALKQNGVMVSDGYSGSSDSSGAVMMLELWGDHADIRSLTRDNLYGSSAPNILGGLSEDANKSAASYLGRTFIGIDDTDGDGLYDKVMVFNSSYARQADASTVLRNFGADKIIMFDGGGSTQLLCGANAYISSSRAIPQTIGVISGNNSAPNTPSNFRVDNSTQTSITIAWDDTSYETGYKIYKWDWVSSFVYFSSVGADVTSFTDNTLTCGDEAYYEVSAYNAKGESVHAGWVHGFTQGCSLPIFADVPSTYWASTFIERLYNFGVTGGCSTNPLNYCPTAPVTRAQMAIFILRAEHGAAFNPPAATGSVFLDVPNTYWAAKWIEALSAEGITGGCGSSNYCPDTVVTRDQMAVFLLRGEHGSSYTPPAMTGTLFIDVPAGYWAGAWIEALAAEGITGGCGNNNYCPTTVVTRDQMAVFLVRAFNLP